MLANLTGNNVSTFDLRIASDGTLYDENGAHVPFAFIIDAQEYVSCPCALCVQDALLEAQYEAEQDRLTREHDAWADEFYG